MASSMASVIVIMMLFEGVEGRKGGQDGSTL